MAKSIHNQNKQDGQQTFLSPILVFLFGAPFAALNWWRMNNRKKAVTFLLLLVLVNLLISWLEPEMHIMVDGLSIGEIRYQSLFIITIYNLITALIISGDTKKFNEMARETVPVHWLIIIPFILCTFITVYGIQSGFTYLARSTKYCHFPEYQDLLYDRMLDERNNLRNVLLNHYDTECQVNWSIEDEFPLNFSDEFPQPTSAFYVNLIGHQKNVPESFITVRQVVVEYDLHVTRTMIDSIANGRLSETSQYNIELDVPSADILDYACTYDKYKRCFIILGYKKLIVWVEISAKNIIEPDFENIINLIIRKVDVLANQYDDVLYSATTLSSIDSK